MKKKLLETSPPVILTQSETKGKNFLPVKKKLLLVTLLCSLWTLVVAQGIILEGTGGIGGRSYSLDGVFLPYDAGSYGSQEYFARMPSGGGGIYDFEVKFGISPFKNSNLYFIGEYGMSNSYEFGFSSREIEYGTNVSNRVYYKISGDYKISQDYYGGGILYVMLSDYIATRFAATVGEVNGTIDIPYRVSQRPYGSYTPSITASETQYYDMDKGIIINTSVAIMPRNGGITVGAKYTFTNNHVRDLDKEITSSTIGAFLGYNFIARMDTGKRAIQKAIKQAMRNPNIKNYSRIAVMLPIENQTMRERYISDIEFVLLRENYIPVDRNAIDTALRRAEVDQSRNQAWVFDDRTALTAGRETQAQYILTGNLETIGGKRRLSIRVLEAETGDVVGRAFIDNI